MELLNPVVPASPPTGAECIRAWMTSAPYTVPEEMPLAVAGRFMADRRIRHLPVVKDRKLVGMLLDKDVHPPGGTDKLVVRDVMKPTPYTVLSTASVREVVRSMVLGRHESSVVCDGGRPIGIFTAVDALKILDVLLSGRTPAAPLK